MIAHALLLLLSSLASPAHAIEFYVATMDEASAQEPVLEETQETQFVLAGKGIGDRRHNYNLALACINKTADKPCDKFRFLFFGSDNKAYFVGRTFSFEKIAAGAGAEMQIRTETDLQAYLKTLHKEALKKHRNRLLAASICIFVTTWGLGGAGAFSFMTLSENAYFLGGFIAFPMVASAAYLSPGIIDPFTVAKNLAQGGTNGQQLSNQAGWNWSDRPTKVSPLYFREFIRAINRDAHTLLVKKYRKLRETQW